MRTLFAVLFVAAVALAAPKPILRITVEPEKKTDRDVKQRGALKTDKDGNTWVTPSETEKTEKVVLIIKIQSLSPGELKGLTLKYAVFSRDRETKAVNIAGDGDRTIDIKPPKIEAVKSDAISFSTQETKFTVGEVDPRNNKTSGQKYYGCAVVIYQAGDKIASYYTPDSLSVEAPKLGW